LALVTGSSILDIRSDLGINYLFDDYVVNDYVVQGTEAADLDLASVLTITSATVTVDGVKTAVFDSSLSIQSTVTATAQDLDLASATLSSTATISATAARTRSASATLPINATVTATGVETAEEGTATLDITANVEAAAVRTRSATANLDISAEITAQGVLTTDIPLNISTSLTASVGQTGEANLSITATVVIAGEDIDVDPFNTYRVAQEIRTLVVPEESRLIKVMEETRVNTVPVENRDLKVMQETREYKIKRPVFAGATRRRNS
jgi:hypothetical protein